MSGGCDTTDEDRQRWREQAALRKAEEEARPLRIRFTVPGPPVPKARARIVTDEHGETHGRTPTKTRKYEKHIMMCALAARMRCPRWPNKDKAARFGIAIRVYRSVDRGDMDNYEKSVMDACRKGIVYHDDSQIRRRGEGGIYDVPKGQERIDVEVWVL